MEARNIFENISPLDHRYSLSDPSLFEALGKSLSESANIAYCVTVECALLKAHIENTELDTPENRRIIDELAGSIDPEEVAQEEEKTRHNVRALVNVMKRHVPEPLKPFIHLGATSVDILDTSQAMRMRDAVKETVLPLLYDVCDLLIEITANEADTPQVGRTHGQFAVPVTFGFATAEYVARLGKSAQAIAELSGELRGKLSGAVGAYNAMSLLVDDPEAFERKVLAYLGLQPSEYSNQLAEPEHNLRLVLEMNVAFGILANLADDLRHLQRSEIDEVREFFSSTQVGSSTMPQKRNPWNSEHVKSLWKAFSPRVMTLFMDQISEHQRDLSNSASARFTAEYVMGFCSALSRMKKILASLNVDSEAMLKNLTMTGDMVLAEAAYLVLSILGDPEAHETVRLATLRCEKNGTSLAAELKSGDVDWENVDSLLKARVGVSAAEFFSNPRHYCGKARERALNISNKYRTVIQTLREGK